MNIEYRKAAALKRRKRESRNGKLEITESGNLVPQVSSLLYRGIWGRLTWFFRESLISTYIYCNSYSPSDWSVKMRLLKTHCQPACFGWKNNTTMQFLTVNWKQTLSNFWLTKPRACKYHNAYEISCQDQANTNESPHKSLSVARADFVIQ